MIEYYLKQIVLMALPLLVAVTFHELAHGFVAYRLGDPTAKLAGRLTLNPLKHLDPLGTLVFIMTRMIGWAKPVPVNPFNLRDPKKDMIWVSLAGPAANMLIAVASALLYKIVMILPVENVFIVKKILVPVALMLQLSVILNIGLAVFNLIPIPPLDGSKILMGILPPRQAIAFSRIEPYGFFIILILLFLRVIDLIIFPIIIFLRDLLI
ncbi:MAG: site-2 protease family protein [Nitrospirae bacterium]|nr:site-2 protease family protein [Nitrospirota bacterium]